MSVVSERFNLRIFNIWQKLAKLSCPLHVPTESYHMSLLVVIRTLAYLVVVWVSRSVSVKSQFYQNFLTYANDIGYI